MKNKVINKNFHTKNIITCDNLSIFVGSKKHPSILIDNFNCSFEKNKIYAIVGASGVGKTTLVSHFNGLLKSNVGNIFINKDKAILGCQKKIRDYKDIRKDVSLVFQFPEYQIIKDTVEKDITLGPINYGVNKKNAKKLATKCMHLVGLQKSLLHVNPFELSNGQKRLVAIAGILAIDSKVVIFDEPTAGLDSSSQKNILKIIKQLKKQGKTIIIITHNMDNVLELADEVLVIHKQRLNYFGTPYEVFTDQHILNETGIAVPHVILMIKKLISHNKKYEILLKAQPKTLTQLVKLLKKGEK